MKEFLRHTEVVPLDDLGGGRRAIFEWLEKVSGANYGAPVLHGSLHDVPLTQLAREAKWVDSRRVAIPERAGGVRPEKILPPSKAAIIENFAEWAKLPPEACPLLPRSCHKVSRREERRLALKCLRSGLCSLVREDQLDRDLNTGRPIIGGFFAVGKATDRDADRLIFDKRPGNSRCRRLRWLHLPQAVQLRHIFLGKNQLLVGSGRDLAIYFFKLDAPANTAPSNAVGGPLRGRWLQEFGADSTSTFYLSMNVWGMGDSNAPCVAQAVHEQLLFDCQAVRPQDLIRYKVALPNSKCLVGVYLDDLLVLQLQSRASYDSRVLSNEDPRSVHPVVAKAEVAYRKAGLDISEKKSFDSQLEYKAWGLEVNGDVGTLQFPILTRVHLMVIITLLIQLGVAERKLMEVLLGSLTAAFLPRKEFLSLFHRI